MPVTPRWRRVKALIAEGADTPQLAESVVQAAIAVFGDADRGRRGRLADEPGAIWSCWLLMTIPFIAKQQGAFADLLTERGLSISDQAFTTPAQFIAAVSEGVRRKTWAEGSGNFSELAISALREVLTRSVGTQQGSLFSTREESLRDSWAQYGTAGGFSRLVSDYLGTLLKRSIAYYLSKELPLQVGPGRRFKGIHELASIDDDLSTWAQERAQIAHEFSSGWLSKRRYQHGEPTVRAAKEYLSYALAKVGSEVAAHEEDRAE